MLNKKNTTELGHVVRLSFIKYFGARAFSQYRGLFAVFSLLTRGLFAVCSWILRDQDVSSVKCSVGIILKKNSF
jgi:hypothetical protein